MKTEAKQEEKRLKHPLSVRWTDQDYQFVVDQSWRRRIRLSEMVRRLVLEGLRNGVPSAAGEPAKKG